MEFIGPAALTTAVLVTLEAGLLAIALLAAPRDRDPSSALAWILVIIALPGLGLLLFLLIGSSKLPVGRRERQRGMNDRLRSGTGELEAVGADREVPDWFPAIARLNRHGGAMPLLDGNSARLLPHFDEQLAALVAAVDGAQAWLHVEFFILALDDTTAPFFDALERAAARGVRVRVLIDHVGSLPYPGSRRARQRLSASGIEWHDMLPVHPLKGRYQRPDLRNHRKLLVADGVLALVGSLNVIAPGYEIKKYAKRGLAWRDLLAEVRGPVVDEVTAVFVTDWYSETGDLLDVPPLGPADDEPAGDLLCQIAPSGPAFDTGINLALFDSLFYAAAERISVTSPYFVPDESLLAALTTAARRGVAVELFVGATGEKPVTFHAQHSYYGTLLEAGVRIHRYPAPTILHAKHVTIDDHVAVVGSSNLDRRSLNLDLELSMLVCSRSFTDRLREVEDEYRSRSEELSLEEWKRRGRLHRIGDDLARLTSALQ